jgi:hypothetical protein
MPALMMMEGTPLLYPLLEVHIHILVVEDQQPVAGRREAQRRGLLQNEQKGRSGKHKLGTAGTENALLHLYLPLRHSPMLISIAGGLRGRFPTPGAGSNIIT